VLLFFPHFQDIEDDHEGVLQKALKNIREDYEGLLSTERWDSLSSL
jgi:hypothetical protein